MKPWEYLLAFCVAALVTFGVYLIYLHPSLPSCPGGQTPLYEYRSSGKSASYVFVGCSDKQ